MVYASGVSTEKKFAAPRAVRPGKAREILSKQGIDIDDAGCREVAGDGQSIGEIILEYDYDDKAAIAIKLSRLWRPYCLAHARKFTD